MQPPGPHNPIIIGMLERQARPLTLGNHYVVFYKGNKMLGQYVDDADREHIIIKGLMYLGNVLTPVHMLYNRKWVFELQESIAFQN